MKNHFFLALLSVALLNSVALKAQSVSAGYIHGSSGAPTVSSTDLLQTNAALTASSGTFNSYGTTGSSALTDGTAPAGNTLCAGIASDASLTYSFSGSATGYDISSIDIYTSWSDNGRVNPNVTVSFSLAATPAVFVTLGTYSYSSTSGTIWTKSHLAITGLTGVAALKFDFPSQQNGNVGYSEIDVFSPSKQDIVWNFTSDMEGWHDLGGGRDVTASWEAGALKMAYIDGGAEGTQIWFPAIQVDNLNFDAANYRYLELNYQTNNWPTSSPVKMLVQLTRSDNKLIYSYVDIDPTKNFILIDIQANNPGWAEPYSGIIKSIYLEIPHNGDPASNPATNWFSASTMIDKIKVTNTPTPQDVVWDFTASTEGWNPYGDDVTTSHSGSNLVVTYTGGGDGAYNYTTIYTPVSINAANIDKFYMKFTAHNWVKTSVLVNIQFDINGTSYFANQMMTVTNGEFTFDIRDDVQNAWNNLPASGSISQIRIEIPHGSELGNASNWNGATLDIDRIVFSKKQIPDPPTNIVATAGNDQTSVAFIAPASNGGSAILEYTVTSNPGGLTQNGVSSPIVLTGLTNGTAYTFFVTASNSVGTSSASLASNSVTPTPATVSVSSDANISSYFPTSATDVIVTSGVLTIDADATLKSLTVAPGAKLTLTSGKSLSVVGNLILQSNATGTATLVDNTTNSPQAVTATVQQYVTSGRNWYMSIPLASGASSLLNKGTSVVCYDEPSGNWIVPADGTLDKLRGYIQVATSTPSVTGTTGTVDFTGVVNTGAHSINLSRTTGQSGFNLVGNPYPSYLDWNVVTKTNLSNTMWFRTKEGGVYKFYTYVANSGSGVGSPATVTNRIPPMQAFWVRVNTVGTGSIAVDNNMRAHKDVAGNIMKAPSQTPQKLLRLQVSNGVNTDETVLYFNANASDGFDLYDAQKRSNEDVAVPEIYTQVGTEQLVINGMNSVKYDTEIPIGFSTLAAANNNSLSISANEMTNFEAGTRVILIDKEHPSVENELTNGAVYSFSAPVTAPTTSRFSLLFRAPGVATCVDNTTKLNAQVFVNAANQITIIAPEKATYSIYNTVGILLENGFLNYKPHTINCKLTTGVYFVQLLVNGQSEIQKVIIK